MIYYLFCSGLGLRRRRFLTFLKATQELQISVVVMYYSRERKVNFIKQWERYWALYCFMEQYMRQITNVLEGWNLGCWMVLQSTHELNRVECKAPSCSMLWTDVFKVLTTVLRVGALCARLSVLDGALEAVHCINPVLLGSECWGTDIYRFSAMTDLWQGIGWEPTPY